jgi:hypothetical protein
MADSMLDKYLPGPKCELCGTGTIRPVDVLNGQLLFSCSNRPPCAFTSLVPLPVLHKRWIYLGAGIVGRMARTWAGGDSSAPYAQLYQALRTASENNLIAIPGAGIVETGVEYAQYSDVLVEMKRDFTAPGLRRELDVREAQLSRALDRWMNGEEPLLEVDPPWQDAFDADPDVWQTAFRTFLTVPAQTTFPEFTKREKESALPEIAAAYQTYSDSDRSFEQMVAVEKTWFGKSAIMNGREAYASRKAVLRGEAIDTENVPFTTTVDKLTIQIDRHAKCGSDEAYARTIEFLVSPHAAEIPFSYSYAHLQAAFALLCRGPEARYPTVEDQYAIEHMATFMPYVDVFVADPDMAAMANETRVGEKFNAKIQALGEKDVTAFIEWLEGLSAGDDLELLSRRVNEAMILGGFHQYVTVAPRSEVVEEQAPPVKNPRKRNRRK